MELTFYLKKIPLLELIFTYLINTVWRVVRFFYMKFPYKENNLAIIVLHKLGDTVFTLPAVREIFKNYTGHNIFIYCFGESVPIIQLVFPDCKIQTVDKKEFIFDQRIAKSSARKKLSSLKPSIIFDLTGVMTAATLIFNSRSSQIIGMNTKYYKGIYSHYVSLRREPQLADIYLDAIEPVIKIINREQLKSYEIGVAGKGNILISPGAGWVNKEWGLKNFIELTEHLNREYEVVLTFLPNTVSEDVISYLKEIKIRFLITSDVAELINEIKKSALILSNDTGPIYIGSLLGKHTFTLYGPTNPDYTFPGGVKHHYVQKVLECSPGKEKYCFAYNTLNCLSNECMRSLSVDFVEDELRKFINRSNPEIITK